MHHIRSIKMIRFNPFSEGVFVEASDVRVFEPNNMAKSLKKRKIQVCDRIYYKKANKNISLKVEKLQ